MFSFILLSQFHYIQNKYPLWIVTDNFVGSSDWRSEVKSLKSLAAPNYQLVTS